MIAISLNYKYVDSEGGAFVLDRFGTRLNPAAVETKVSVFEDRVNGWFLRVAEDLRPRTEGDQQKGDGGAGFAALMIAVAQIEAVEQYRRGETSEPVPKKMPGRSKEFFVSGMKTIFDLEDGADEGLAALYKDARCGLFHNGITQSRVGLSGDFEQALAFNDQYIQINPWLFVDRVKTGVAAYVAQLRDPANGDLRDRFLVMFKL